MGFGAIVIGDEIMRGKRQDKHFPKVIELLGARGLALDWCQHAGDDRARLTELLRASFAGGDAVLCFGGIGATPDDHTRQAAAAALGVPLALHPQAEAEIRARFGAETTALRLQLAEFPVGAQIVPNPYNRIAGFSVRGHYFLPGFPEMAWPMAQWVLDTHYAHLHHANPVAEHALRVYETPESALIELLRATEARYAEVRTFSLPTFGGNGVRRHIEVGVRGPATPAAAAMAMIRGDLVQRGLEIEDVSGGTR